MDRSAVKASVHAFALSLPDRLSSSKAGERLGTGTGSSTEFEDYRDYAPGDDIRHID